MYKNLTLRDRIFLISSVLILTAIALIWVFIRPKYREAIIRERTTIVSQLQEYTLRQTDNTVRNWLNTTNLLAEDLIQNPGDTQALITKAISYTPGLMRIVITDTESGQEAVVNRTIYDGIDYGNIEPVWYPSRLNEQINISWLIDTEQPVDFLIARRAIQLGSDIYTLDTYYDTQSLNDNLSNIPLGEDNLYVANIVDAAGNNFFPGAEFDFPEELVGDASFSNEKTIELNEQNWFVVSSRFQSIPFWHLIAVEDGFILEPVNRLIQFSLISAGTILLFMLGFSYYVSIRINRPINTLIHDVEHLTRLDFEHPIRDLQLPEFQEMHDTLENIRQTMRRYQKLNVEKIILEEWKNRYMVTYSEDLIAVVDADGSFSFINNHFTEFLEDLELNPKQATLDKIIDHEYIVLHKGNQTVYYPEPYTVKVEQAELTQYSQKEEHTYYYDFQHVAILDDSENQIGGYIMIHDKTDDRLLDIKRNDMINVIVHELKNPITGVVGITKLIMDNQSMSREEQNTLLNEVYMSGERMNQLVNRFLEVQKLEAGKINVDFTSVDLAQIVNEVKTLSNPLLSSKKLKLEIKKDGTNFGLQANKDLMFDAVQNLVSNAIKYGDPNRTILAELREEKDQLVFALTDYGFGISQEDQLKVFDKFFRVKSNIKSAKERGTGLGLAYVKEIVAIHNGEITLESEPEFGSRFIIYLPKNQDRNE